MLFNLANLMLIGFLIMRHPGRGRIVEGPVVVQSAGEDASPPQVAASLDYMP